MEHKRTHFREEAYLLELLKNAICSKPEAGSCQEGVQQFPFSHTDRTQPSTGVRPECGIDWEVLLQLADSHGISSLLYDELVTADRLPAQYRRTYERKCQQTVLQSYRLLFLTRAVVRQLMEAGIPTVVLKGAGVAGLYPVPELRKSGDVDILLLKPEQIEQAVAVLGSAGFVQDTKQRSIHHIAMHSPEQIEVEIHTMLAEPFDNRGTNRYIREQVCTDEACAGREEVMGTPLPVLSDGEQAYALLLHMLQHYLRSGFGLKLLCDWAVFWNRTHSAGAEQRYLKLIRESGLEGFSDMVTAVCVRYLGLPRERMAFAFTGSGAVGKLPTAKDTEAFLEEILDGGEFGKSQRDRMVALRGTGPVAYVREFHHQMQLNYPEAGMQPLFWPALWMATLLRFLRNNRTIRHVSAGSLLRKAGQRSRLTAKLGLFER